MKGTIAQPSSYVFGDFHSVHPPLVEQLKELEAISQTDLSVLLSGETGTGKELLARAVHQKSTSHHGNFIPINCASILADLLESELFGHERGAFTGADTKKPGQFVLAHSGTLFLDEIGDLPKQLQPKLLRALETNAVQPVGSTKLVPTDFRLICATNRDLEAMVQCNEFREDLYYRICGFVFKIPLLRERKADIAILCDYFLEKYAAHHQKDLSELSPLVWSRLYAHDWPGNGRELEGVIDQAVILCKGDIIDRQDLPTAYQGSNDSQTSLAALIAPIIIASERQVILAALQQQGGHRGRTAEVLGISPRTLYRKMLIYEITILS